MGGGGEKELQSNISNLPTTKMDRYIYNFVAFGALSVTLQIIKCKVSG